MGAIALVDHRDGVRGVVVLQLLPGRVRAGGVNSPVLLRQVCLGVEDLGVEVILLGEGDGRFEVLVVLGVGAHHVGGAGHGGGLGPGLAVLAPIGVGPGDGPGGGVAAGEGAAEDRPQAPADAAGQRRDRGAGEQHPADDQQQHGEDAGADLPAQVVERGFGAVADLATLPAEEEDEDQIDAEGDEEKGDQVEVALLQPAGQPQPRFRFRFPFGRSFPASRRSGALLTHEHGPPFDAGRRSPAS